MKGHRDAISVFTMDSIAKVTNSLTRKPVTLAAFWMELVRLLTSR